MKLAYTTYGLFSLGPVKQTTLQMGKFLFSKVNPALEHYLCVGGVFYIGRI